MCKLKQAVTGGTRGTGEHRWPWLNKGSSGKPAAMGWMKGNRQKHVVTGCTRGCRQRQVAMGWRLDIGEQGKASCL